MYDVNSKRVTKGETVRRRRVRAEKYAGHVRTTTRTELRKVA